MQLHEGKLIKRALVLFKEGLSAGTRRTVLRLTEWFATLSAEQLNRTVLYIQVWDDRASDAVASDSVDLFVKAHGKEWQRELAAVGRVGGTNNQRSEHMFSMAYPSGINPSTPNDTLVLFRVLNWAVTETHTYLIEVSAYLLDVKTDVIEVEYI